jgi:hypothetical protein
MIAYVRSEFTPSCKVRAVDPDPVGFRPFLPKVDPDPYLHNLRYTYDR